MSIYEEAPAADPRALLSAAVLGSIAGLVLGGGYLLLGRLGAPAPAVPARVFGPPLASVAAPAPHTPPAASVVASPPAPAALRWLRFAAPPFRPASADTGGDRECLTQAIYYEARGEAAAGQQAVAQVVLNRVRHPAFPKSVCGVVFQRTGAECQFSFACAPHAVTGRDAAAWRRAETVADRALDGFVMRQVGGATHFHVSNLGNTWSQGLARVAQIGAHVFYGLTGRPDGRIPVAPTMREARAPTPSETPAAGDAVPGDAPRVHLVLASATVETTVPFTPAAVMTTIPAHSEPPVIAPTVVKPFEPSATETAATH